MNTHTRKEALGGQRHAAPLKTSGSPLELHQDPMPEKSKGGQATNPTLDVGGTEAGLGPMPWRRAY